MAIKFKDVAGWAAIGMVGALIALTVALKIYRVIHPIPDSQRAFIPQYACRGNQYEGEVCEKTQPSTP